MPIMEARLVVLENRLRRTEEVLVLRRLARWFAESAQQMVGAKSAGIEGSLGATGLVGARECVLSRCAGDVKWSCWCDSVGDGIL